MQFLCYIVICKDHAMFLSPQPPQKSLAAILYNPLPFFIYGINSTFRLGQALSLINFLQVGICQCHFLLSMCNTEIKLMQLHHWNKALSHKIPPATQAKFFFSFPLFQLFTMGRLILEW